jgi:hypothetical protein
MSYTADRGRRKRLSGAGSVGAIRVDKKIILRSVSVCGSRIRDCRNQAKQSHNNESLKSAPLKLCGLVAAFRPAGAAALAALLVRDGADDSDPSGDPARCLGGCDEDWRPPPAAASDGSPMTVAPRVRLRFSGGRLMCIYESSMIGEIMKVNNENKKEKKKEKKKRKKKKKTPSRTLAAPAAGRAPASRRGYRRAC